MADGKKVLKRLVLSTQSPVDASRYTQVGLNYTLNYFFRNSSFKKIHVVKETTLIVEKKPV